jgi:hypothetical protein
MMKLGLASSREEMHSISSASNQFTPMMQAAILASATMPPLLLGLLIFLVRVILGLRIGGTTLSTLVSSSIFMYLAPYLIAVSLLILIYMIILRVQTFSSGQHKLFGGKVLFWELTCRVQGLVLHFMGPLMAGNVLGVWA